MTPAARSTAARKARSNALPPQEQNELYEFPAAVEVEWAASSRGGGRSGKHGDDRRRELEACWAQQTSEKRIVYSAYGVSTLLIMPACSVQEIARWRGDETRRAAWSRLPLLLLLRVGSRWGPNAK